MEEYHLIFPERSEPLHSMLFNCGHQRTSDRSYCWHGQKRGSHELVIWQYTIAGEGRLRFGSDEFTLLPNQAMLLIVPEDHCYFLPEHSPEWEFLYISVHGSELVRLAGEFRRQHGVILPFSSQSETLRLVWDTLKLCREHKLDHRYEASCRAYMFMMTLMREYAHVGHDGSRDFLEKIHSYCLKNLHRPIAVRELAQLTHCSYWHFSRRFQQLEGKSPHEFIIELKISMAVRLLQSSNESIKEIAGRCGFDDVSYFCKVFRRIQRITPGEFRRFLP